MALVFLVNDLPSTEPKQTTAMLIETACARGHRVLVVGAAEVAVDQHGMYVPARRAAIAPTRGKMLRALRDAPRGGRHVVGPGDVILVRTNPARDRRGWAHVVLLDALRVARDSGASVVNSVEGLASAGTKIHLAWVAPPHRPRTLVTRDPLEIERFVAESDGPAVLKPVRGTRGADVFLVEREGRHNLRQIIDVLTRRGFAVVQEYVPEARDGDVRVLLLDGAPLRVGDAVAAVRRVPPRGDFRSNVAVGGKPAPATMSPTLQAICDAVGPRLVAEGIRLAGLDVIGDKVVEINVYSPGGLFDANRFHKVDFTQPVLDAFAPKARRRKG